MAAQLEAAMRLRLEDAMSGPLAKIQATMDRIMEIGRAMNLDKFTAGLAPLERAQRQAKDVAQEFRNIGEQASGAVPGLAEMVEGVEAVGEQARPLAGVAQEFRNMGAPLNEAAGASKRLADALERAESAARGIKAAGTIGVDGMGGARMLNHSMVPQMPFVPHAANPWAHDPEPGDPASRKPGMLSHVAGKGMDPFMAMITGGALYEAIKTYAGFENQLRQIAITEHLSGNQVSPEEARLTKLFYADAQRTGQTSDSIAEAYKELLQIGIPKALIDRAIGIHSMAATAYGVTTAELGPTVGAMLQNMHIDDKELGGALAAIAEASKSGRFKMTDFATLYSGVAAQFAAIGITGRSGVNLSAAALETVMKNSSNPGQASQDLNDLLRYMYSPREDKSLNKILGVDLKQYLHEHTEHGEDPLSAYLNLLRGKFKGLSPNDASQLSNELLRNSQAQSAALALIMHNSDYQGLQTRLGQQTGQTLQVDFKTATDGSEYPLNKLRETLTELSNTMGQSLAPAIMLANSGFGWINEKLHWANTNFPQTTHWVLGLSVGALALAAALGVIGFVAGPVGAGLALLVSPIGLIVAGIALIVLGAYEMYAHWGNMTRFFAAQWAEIKAGFDDFVKWLERWIVGPAGTVLKTLREAFALGFDPGALAPAGIPGAMVSPRSITAPLNMPHDVRVQVHVTTEHGTTATATVTGGRATVSTANRGKTLGRP